MYLLTLTLTFGCLGGRSCPVCPVGGFFGEVDRMGELALAVVSMSRLGCRIDDDVFRYHN